MAEEPAVWQLKIAEHADRFEKTAASLVAVERLTQRSYNLPPHAHFAIGKAAGPLYAQYLTHEVFSDYSIGLLKSGSATTLVERREVLSLDGRKLPAVEAPRKEVVADLTAARRRTLESFAKLGLSDIATEYGLILLAFTTASRKSIRWEDTPPRAEFVGTEEALVYDWAQTASGAVEFLGRKTTVRPMRGSIWLRKSDGAPLRVHATIEHSEKDGRKIADVASVEYSDSPALPCLAPLSVVVRHFAGDRELTENLYTYERFRQVRTEGRKSLAPLR